MIGYPIAGDFLDGFKQGTSGFGLAPAVPAYQVDGVKLTKAQGRPAAVQRNRNKSACVSTLSRFVLNPGGFDRRAAPQDDDSLRVLQLSIDFGREARPALNLPVPPHVMPGVADALRQFLRSRSILARVTQKDLRQTVLPEGCRGMRQRLRSHKQE